MDNIILDLTQLSDFDLETYLLERIKKHTLLLTKKQIVDATYREQQKQTDMAYAAYEAELRHLRQLGDHCESALENVIDMGNMVKRHILNRCEGSKVMTRKKYDFPPRQVDMNRKLTFHWQQFIREVQDAALKVALASEPIELSSDPMVALRDLMEHVQNCNSQSSHFPEIDCLPNHPDECSRCVAVRQAKRILEAHDESQRH